MTPYDIDRFLNALKQSPNYKISSFSCLYVLIPLIFCAGLIIMVTSLINTITAEKPSSSVLPFITMPLTIAVIFIVICCYSCCKESTYSKRYKSFYEIATRENVIIRAKEVRWTVGTLGAWVALELDFVSKN
jgi:glucan phosphoethanolaminetransferase (alkaline phosphatase superfamily)